MAVLLVRTGFAVGGMAAVVAVLAAVTTIWLVLTHPAALADAIADRGGPALVRAIADLIVGALQQIARWL